MSEWYACLTLPDGYGKLPIRVNAYLPLADWKRVRDHPTRNGGWFREINSNDDDNKNDGDDDDNDGKEGGKDGDDGEDDSSFSPTPPSSSARQQYGDSSRLRVAGCKAFLDGSLGAGTALMREPYADDPSGVNRGIAVCNLTEFARRVVEADGAGLQVAVHAIGDAAVVGNSVVPNSPLIFPLISQLYKAANTSLQFLFTLKVGSRRTQS